jgi:hypothetical protein
MGQPEGKGLPLLNDLRFLATFGDSFMRSGRTRPGHEEENAPYPPAMTEAYRRFTKSGQEPDLIANDRGGLPYMFGHAPRKGGKPTLEGDRDKAGAEQNRGQRFRPGATLADGLPGSVGRE